MQVLRYLQAFAAAFQLHQYITFDTEVVSAVPLFPAPEALMQQQQQQQQLQQPQQQQQQQPQQQPQQPGVNSSGGNGSCPDDETRVQQPLPWPRWQITTQPLQHNRQSTPNTAQTAAGSQNGDATHDSTHADGHSNNGHASHAQVGSDRRTDGHSQTATYDALVVCNGHYSAPRCPEVSGSEAFPGTVMHSHNYRRNEAFRGQTVVLVGASASGEDICREIAEVADKVIMHQKSSVFELCTLMQ